MSEGGLQHLHLPGPVQTGEVVPEAAPPQQVEGDHRLAQENQEDGWAVLLPVETPVCFGMGVILTELSSEHLRIQKMHELFMSLEPLGWSDRRSRSLEFVRVSLPVLLISPSNTNAAS